LKTYRVAGLSVSSEIPLRGLATASPDLGADVIIRGGPVAATLQSPAVVGPNWQIAGDRFLLRIPGIARFLLNSGREIVVDAADGTPIEETAVFVAGAALGILLHQRGRVVLHASAVEVSGAAVLFCGPAGAGKSTLAAALAQRGYRPLGDDLCVVEPGAISVAHADGGRLKLWGPCIDALRLARRGAVRRGIDKHYVEPDGAAAEALPIGAVYVLRAARSEAPPGIVRRNVAEAALLLRRNAYRPVLVARMGQEASYLQVAAHLSNAAGVFHLNREFEIEAAPAIVDRLEAHWTEIGLAGAAA
jgi:hypothetical protein